ncbi:MAG TPA: hypothetical protein VK988_12245 [Acidimicrobiales bacterium]|nr:hypothetical protein [Acidimicrobiales bacterium]
MKRIGVWEPAVVTSDAKGAIKEPKPWGGGRTTMPWQRASLRPRSSAGPMPRVGECV